MHITLFLYFFYSHIFVTSAENQCHVQKEKKLQSTPQMDCLGQICQLCWRGCRPGEALDRWGLSWKNMIQTFAFSNMNCWLKIHDCWLNIHCWLKNGACFLNTNPSEVPLWRSGVSTVSAWTQQENHFLCCPNCVLKLMAWNSCQMLTSEQQNEFAIGSASPGLCCLHFGRLIPRQAGSLRASTVAHRGEQLLQPLLTGLKFHQFSNGSWLPMTWWNCCWTLLEYDKHLKISFHSCLNTKVQTKPHQANRKFA